jgi:hypothetical protein
MDIYGPAFFDDAALTAEIQAYVAARRTLAQGGGVAVIAGDNRRVEYVGSNIGDLDQELRNLQFEARKRGLAIGGCAGGSIGVETIK